MLLLLLLYAFVAFVVVAAAVVLINLTKSTCLFLYPLSIHAQSPGHVRLCQDINTFGYLARSNYPPQIKNFPALVLHVGWTVEGRDRSQLPEQLLSGLTVIRADLSKGDGANTDKLNHLLEEYHVGNGIDPYKITPKQWLERGLQQEK